ncbi:MAG: hypothetical protein KFH98_09870 [Gemmatimonadetes bacterium]|nr:hypothetical protein [Gemmatimonadota bacterium]
MGRLIGGVLLGYVTIAFVVFAALSLAYVAVGTDGAFRPGVFDVSPLWMAISIVVGFGAAFLGGVIARRIVRDGLGPKILAGVIVFLGVVMALTAGGAAEVAGVRTESIGTFEAMQFAQTPFWMMLLNPVIGAIGVLLGGGVLGPGRAKAAPDVVAT